MLLTSVPDQSCAGLEFIQDVIFVICLTVIQISLSTDINFYSA